MKTAKILKMMQSIRQDLYRLRLVLLILLIYGMVTQFIFHTVCPFAILAGFPCPACGMTRAFLLFAAGQFRLSFILHPLVLPWSMLVLYLGYYRYIKDGHAPFVWPLTILLCLATFACYLLRLTAGTLPEVPIPGILHLAISDFTC